MFPVTKMIWKTFFSDSDENISMYTNTACMPEVMCHLGITIYGLMKYFQCWLQFCLPFLKLQLKLHPLYSQCVTTSVWMMRLSYNIRMMNNYCSSSISTKSVHACRHLLATHYTDHGKLLTILHISKKWFIYKELKVYAAIMYLSIEQVA